MSEHSTKLPRLGQQMSLSQHQLARCCLTQEERDFPRILRERRFCVAMLWNRLDSDFREWPPRQLPPVLVGLEHRGSHLTSIAQVPDYRQLAQSGPPDMD